MNSSTYSHNQNTKIITNNFYIQSSSTSPFASPLPKPFEVQIRKEMKPCQKFGLDPFKLENQELFKHRSYRRLYNIVANDQTEANQVFRPNLIKELYFLLQITPFIQYSLRDGFLGKIQDWYNSNDHKKIKLSKNLDGIIQNVLHQKNSKQNGQKTQNKAVKRPKTGNQWDTSLVSFLRPYTGKLRCNNSSQHKHRQSIQKSYRRPESSKFGLSTNDNTNYWKQKSRINGLSNQHDQFQQENVQFLLQNQNIEEQIQKCDIQEEWERSLDFKKKYRTIHPQEEPTYQKLMSLILELRDNKQNTGNKNNLSNQKKRKIQSATLSKQIQNAKNLAQKELNLKNDDPLDQQNIQAQMGKENEDSGDESDVYIEVQQELLNLQQKNKNFISDKRTKEGTKLYNPNNKNHLYQTLNGVKILRPFTAKQNHIINKLDQYSSMEQNKRVIQTKIDEECGQKYKQFIKNKNAIKRQIMRRSQSKRYMQNFKSIVKVIPTQPKNKLSVGDQKENFNKNQENVQFSELNNFKHSQAAKQGKGKVFDYTNMPGIQTYQTFKLKKSTYNVKNYFQPIKKSIISASSRGINKFDIEQSLQIHDKMTNPKRLLSEQKFDPLHKNNLQNYNRQALQEIERIKEKISGKITVSTQSLLKALYIDAGVGITEQKSLKGQQNKLKVPDKSYLMINKEQKSKKRRKIKKKKGNSVKLLKYTN